MTARTKRGMPTKAARKKAESINLDAVTRVCILWRLHVGDICGETTAELVSQCDLTYIITHKRFERALDRLVAEGSIEKKGHTYRLKRETDK